MKEFKGTNGEWRVGQTPHEPKNDIGIRYFVIADIINRDERNRDDRFIYNQFVSRNEVMDIHNESYANAKLISAAPMLLEALKECLEGVEKLNDDFQDGWDEVIEKAKVAINKALG